MSSSAPTAPAEVVTEAHVRYVELPELAGADRFALITLDNGQDHTRLNTLGARGLAALERALDEIESHRPAVVGVGLTGKPFSFAAGADLSAVPAIVTREQAVQVGRRGHEVFGRLRSLSVPTFAFVNGLALGGGLELALSCDYRTLSAGPGAVAFPECFLGLVPGWGGCWLLPNLLGADAAVTMILANPLSNNKLLRPEQAAALGLADEFLQPADFLERSLQWAGEVISGRTLVRRAAPDRGEAWDAAIARGQELLDTKLHGSAPAPYQALKLIERARTLDAEAGFAAEDEALADLLLSDELRAGLYAFDLTQKRARKPAGAPDPASARPVTKVGVVGAGLMASQLALLFARRMKVPVVLTDIDQQRLDAGLARVHREIATLAGKNKITPDLAARLAAGVTGSLSYAAFADADLVIEAVFEDLDVKREVFGQLEQVVSPTCVLATNTSSLPVTAMATGLQHPGRVVGLHFFNPVAVLPLLEVVRAERTDDATLATGYAVGKALRKSCVPVADAPAFVVNRILTRLLAEVFTTLDEGTDYAVVDHALDPLGLPMSPFVLLQLVGPGIALHVAETLHAAFPDRFAVSSNLRRIAAAGRPGIYGWDERGQPYVDPDVDALLQRGDKPSDAEQIRERALTAIADEIRRMLDEHVVPAAADIDLALLLGARWPFHLGGITPYLDRTGIAERVTGARFTPPGVATLPDVPR